MQKADTLIFIPTYNEKNNVQPLFERIIKSYKNADILFLDDNSPDGTGNKIDEMIKSSDRLYVIHRPKKLGIGSAHKEGFQWAIERGYKNLVTMDSDFTHSPEDIPKLIANSKDTEVVIASRYLDKDGIKDWNILRKTLSQTAHFLTTVLLDLKYDTTGAFRFYRLDRIDKNFLNKVRSNGYSFFFESIYVLHNMNYTIDEVPVILPTRFNGNSKMGYRDLLNSIRLLCVLTWERVFQKTV